MRIWILLCLMLVSCVGIVYRRGEVVEEKINRDVYIDIDFRVSEREKIERVVREWDNAIGGMRIEVVGNYRGDGIGEIVRRRGIIIKKIGAEHYLVDDTGGRALAFTDAINGSVIYIIRGRVSEDILEPVIRHEMGHIMGVEHQDDGLMYYRFNLFDYQCIDEKTIDSVVRVWKLDKRGMSYCVR